MIYTTYFAKVRNLPENVVPIAICAKVPDWFIGAEYRKLAPKYNTLMNYKRTGDVNTYKREYKDLVLSALDANSVIKELKSLITHKTDSVALVCYEKPADFCHRHLVAEWLQENGFECEEWCDV